MCVPIRCREHSQQKMSTPCARRTIMADQALSATQQKELAINPCSPHLRFCAPEPKESDVKTPVAAL